MSDNCQTMLAMELPNRASKARLLNEDSIPDHLKCSSCSKLLINCFQTPHCRLCQHCVTSKLLPSSRRICPCSPNCIDEDEINKKLMNQAACIPDIATRREISQLTVHCPNIGCQEQLIWRQVNSHLAKECEFEIETCNLCSKEIVHYKLHTNHKNLQSDDCCLEFSAFCPLCGDNSRKLNRAKFIEHQKICPERQTECKYMPDGCLAVVKRSELDEHYRCYTDMHLELTVRKLQHDGDRKDILLKEMQEKFEESLEEQRKMLEEMNKRQDEQRNIPEARCDTQDEQMEVHVEWNGVQKTYSKAQQDEPVRELLRANELKDAQLKEMQEKLDKLQIQLDNVDRLQRVSSIKRLQRTSADDTNANKVRRLGETSQLPAGDKPAGQGNEHRIPGQNITSRFNRRRGMSVASGKKPKTN